MFTIVAEAGTSVAVNI